MKKLLLIIACLTASYVQGGCCDDTCPKGKYPRSIFVPRQLAYNPLLENAFELEAKMRTNDWKAIFSLKPLYAQSVGDKFSRYFTIGHKECLQVSEAGDGDVDPIWFSVISDVTSFYSSTLSFDPKRQTFGAGLYAAFAVNDMWQILINTALVGERNNMHIQETNITHFGAIGAYRTVTESFAGSDRLYGKICGTRSKIGLDDVQIKLLRQLSRREKFSCDIYGLLGVPTSAGSHMTYMFEPLVGSKHAQLGFGSYLKFDVREYSRGNWTFFGEGKYRYGLPAHEKRTVDLCSNGQWSRFLAFVHSASRNLYHPAVNELTLMSKVTPRSSLDLYASTHWNINKWHFELGYDFWYRSEESINVDKCSIKDVAIADLVGIVLLKPQSASTATCQRVVNPGINMLQSDCFFTPVTINDVNPRSAAAPMSFSNSVYASFAYEFQHRAHDMRAGLAVSYERGHGVNVPDNVMVWADVTINF